MPISIYQDQERDIILDTCKTFFFAQRDANNRQLFEEVHNFGSEQRQFYIEKTHIDSPWKLGIRMFHRKKRTFDFGVDITLLDDAHYGRQWQQLLSELDPNVFAHGRNGCIWLKNDALIMPEDIHNEQLIRQQCRLLLGVMMRFYELTAPKNC